MNKFFNSSQINPKLELLQQKYSQIKKEFNENFNNLVWFNWHGGNNYRQIENSPYNGWKVAPIMMDTNGITDIKNFSKELSSTYHQNVFYQQNDNIFLLQNGKYMPTLVSTLLECNIKKRVGISVVFPGKEIKWHKDNDYATIRGLWGLDIKEEDIGESSIYLGSEYNFQKIKFKNNELIFFWGGTKHMVSNTLQTPRYVVLFDQDISRDLLLKYREN
jgi:hypothetical protein